LKAGVKPWELEFVKKYVQPNLTDLDEAVKQLEEAAREDAEDVTNELVSMLFNFFSPLLILRVMIIQQLTNVCPGKAFLAELISWIGLTWKGFLRLYKDDH
jgi:hypothetical protein